MAAMPTLRSPFPSVHMTSSAKRVTAPDLPAQHDLLGVSYYVDEKHSVADPQRKQANNAAMEPIRNFARTVSALADKSEEGAGEAAIKLLARWAAQDALLGEVNRQGASEREWTLCALALAYLKVRDIDGLDTEKQQVEKWFVTLAHSIQPMYETPPSRWNNHAYWAGLAVSATGIAANDRQLFDWGMIRARAGVDAVQDDGTLPLEMKRGQRAILYHLFALTPLVMLAEIGAANGEDLYQLNNRGISRLVDRLVRGLSDPDWFSQQAGVRQESLNNANSQDFAWMEPYYARFHDARLLPWLQLKRPLIAITAGGNLTQMYGEKPH